MFRVSNHASAHLYLFTAVCNFAFYFDEINSYFCSYWPKNSFDDKTEYNFGTVIFSEFP